MICSDAMAAGEELRMDVSIDVVDNPTLPANKVCPHTTFFDFTPGLYNIFKVPKSFIMCILHS